MSLTSTTNTDQSNLSYEKQTNLWPIVKARNFNQLPT